MRLLIDANLSTLIAQKLVSTGYEATHVAHHATGSASDVEVEAFTAARIAVGLEVSDAARRSRQRHPREQAGHLGAI